MVSCRLWVLLGLAVVACGCSPDGAPGGSSSGSAKAPIGTEPTLPPSLALAEPPAGAKGVLELRASAKTGDAVVMKGIVGGSVHPFVAERAVMTLVDPTVPNRCVSSGDDHCKTPWDYCCDSVEAAKGLATVQVLAADGKQLAKAGLEGFAGLKPLSEVIVVGQVFTAQPGVLVVHATGLHVVK